MHDDRENILVRVLAAFASGKRLVSERSDNLETDHKLVSKALSRMGLKKGITIAEDEEKGLLWFKKK